MFKVGLTGGIGSGKSTVARFFADLGVPVIDADLVAREVVVPDSPCWQAIVEAFGPEILQPDRTLNRAALRQLVFSNDTLRQRLEAILHPAIRAIMWRRAAEATGPYVILAIPLLIETGQFRDVERVLVVDAADTVQRQRIKTRDNLPDDQIEAIFAAQLPRAVRLQHADDIITNDSSLESLRSRVATLHAYYVDLARQQAGSARHE